MKPKTISFFGTAILLFASFAFLSLPIMAGGTSFTDRSKAVATDAKELAVDAGQSVATSGSELWEKVDEQSLTNQGTQEIVAWMIVGGLVGAIAGMLTSLRSSGLGRLGRLLLGLMGAFFGGLAVRLGSLDFGWKPLQIRYEEILFSFAGAVLLLLLWRLARYNSQKKHA